MNRKLTLIRLSSQHNNAWSHLCCFDYLIKTKYSTNLCTRSRNSRRETVAMIKNKEHKYFHRKLTHQETFSLFGDGPFLIDSFMSSKFQATRCYCYCCQKHWMSMKNSWWDSCCSSRCSHEENLIINVRVSKIWIFIILRELRWKTSLSISPSAMFTPFKFDLR